MRYLIAVLLIISTLSGVHSQPCRIAFWNLENLFDTINAPASADDEFTPKGKNRWNTAKYRAKTIRIKNVITDINPAIMGLCEVENDDVIEDILPHGYLYTHYESPDPRGIDVAMIYDPRRVTISASEPIRAAGKLPTRDILRVEVLIDSMMMTLMIVHLPSRRGSDPRATADRRAITAQIDSIAQTVPRILIMGDFNQNPSNELLPKLYNTTDEPFRQGKGSYAYRDVWQMFDQIFVSNSMLTTATLYRNGLLQREGRFRGYPRRGDPSDHLPVYIDLRSEMPK